MSSSKCKIALGGIIASVLLCVSPRSHAATITIVNKNNPNTGFNDAASAAPVGGNAGTTLGQQRLVAFKYAAAIWGASLDGSVAIGIESSFVPLTCDATKGVLGATAPTSAVAHPSFPLPNVWYPLALANQLAGRALDSSNPIQAQFNSAIGGASCLTGDSWYYGLDGKPGPNQFDLVSVALHEFAHGLGFITLTNTQTGDEVVDISSRVSRPDVWEFNMYDLVAKKHWNEMSKDERKASALNPRKLVWDGANMTAAAPGILPTGTPTLSVLPPASIAGEYLVGTAQFGPDLTMDGVSGPLREAVGSTTACTAPLASFSGSIALLDRGGCLFVTKVKNAQDAGASAVVITDNAPGSPPAQMGGDDPTITIPSVLITQADGARIRTALASGPVTVNEHLLRGYRGADEMNRVLLYTPDTWKQGSSVSHTDTISTLLMDPAYTKQTHDLDLTPYLLKDIGWSVANPKPAALSSDLAISVEGPTAQGSGASFKVSVTNNGPDAAPEVEVSGTMLTGGNLQSTSAECANHALPCSLGSIPPGTSKTFTAIYSVPSSPATIQLTMNAAGASPDPVLSNNSETVSGPAPPKSGGCNATAGTDDPMIAIALFVLGLLFSARPNQTGRPQSTSSHPR